METVIKTAPLKARRKFDTTFKLEAVRNWLGSGKSAAVVAKELGLGESRLYAWRKLLPQPRLGPCLAPDAPRPKTLRPSSMPLAVRSAISRSSATF